ncbi:MAG: GNAT family N-acetyltransferase [Planctomycetaceae bacterium]
MPIVRYRIALRSGAAAAPAGVVVRSCSRPDDWQSAIAALVARCRVAAADGVGPVPRAEGLASEWASRPGREVVVWVAVPADDPATCLGLVTLVVTGWGFSVGWLLVDPVARRRGVGRALVAAVAGEVSRRGGTAFAAHTSTAWPAAACFWRSVTAGPVGWASGDPLR